jgi:hypothetical protein
MSDPPAICAVDAVLCYNAGMTTETTRKGRGTGTAPVTAMEEVPFPTRSGRNWSLRSRKPKHR